MALFGTKDHILQASHVLSTGDQFNVEVDLDILYSVAKKLQSKELYLGHTHINSDLTPSENDIEFTKIIEEEARERGLYVVEHYIVTPAHEGFARIIENLYSTGYFPDQERNAAKLEIYR